VDVTNANEIVEALDSRGTARILGCSDASLRLWRTQGRGPRFFRAGKLIRYRRADLETWIMRYASDPEQKPI
jgi:predicted DNA-binding transcriptional regulator AlpA